MFGIRSPEQFPSWWAPDTAFPLSDQSKIIEQWKQDRFETLIFMKTGFADHDETMYYTYYPPQFFGRHSSRLCWRTTITAISRSIIESNLPGRQHSGHRAISNVQDCCPNGLWLMV